MINRLMNSGGVIPFQHLKEIVAGEQGPHLAQILRGIARLAQVAFVTLLQLRICEFQDSTLVYGHGLRRLNQRPQF